MKKLLVLMLTVVMILSFGIIASATEAENTIVTTETELLDALANGGNITLGADIQLTDGWTVDAEKEVVLDLAGNDLTVGKLTSNASIRGKLTVKDTVGGGVSTARNHFIYGELILESGILQNISTNTAGFAVNIDTTGKATISGGSVKAVNTANYAIRVLGNLIVDGGEHSGNHGVISVEGGTATINNGTFTCLGVASQTDNVVYVASGSITINNGTFIADSDSAASGTCVCDSAGTAVIENGTFSNSSGGDVWGVTGGTVIKGGTFENLVETAHVTTGATITNKGETVIKNEDGTLTPALAYVASVNGTGYATFAEAISAAKALAGDVVVEIYDKVTLNVSLEGSYNKLTFVGKDTDAEIYLEVQGYITATGKKLAFNDLILSKSVGGYVGNAGFMNVAFGVYQTSEIVYTNCTFANGSYASSGDVTYTGCTFYRSHDKYGLWAYGDANVTVDKCVFDDYRGIKMYAEGAQKTTELTVKDTDFSALTGKPAIVLTHGESVSLEGGNTYSSTGTFELDLDGAPNGTAITVADGENVTCKNDNGACGVIVDGKIYTTVAQAAEVATSGSTVTLLHSTTESVELPEGTTLDTNGYTAENVTVKKVIVVTFSDGYTKEFTSLADAISYNYSAGSKVSITVYKDITEEMSALYGNIVSGNENGVTITNTCTNWVYVDEALTLGKGVTYSTEAIFVTGAEVKIYGNIQTENLYVADDSTVSIYAPATVVVDGSTHVRRNNNINSGIYVYGDNDNTTVEYKSTYYTGVYSGTFYAKDATVEMGYALFNNSNDASYDATLSLVLDNSSITIIGTKDTQDSFIIDGTTSVSLSNGSSIEDVRDFSIKAGTKLTLSVDETSTISATNMSIAEDVPFVAEKNEDGTYGIKEEKNYVAEVNGVKFETVADALAYAKEQGITDLVITLIGATTKESAIALEDAFNLYAQEAFDSVTFKQADNSVPYYISGIYTGERTNNGTFVFDGVNIIVTDQYIFEGNVKLINNSIFKSISEANCFHYYSTTIVEAGSMLAGVIDDFRGGDLIIDGGLTDGSFSVAPSLQDSILNINWAGSSLTIKNGAYANVNSANEIGRVTINAGADLNVYSSKLETVEYITNNGTINVDINSIIKTGKITGAGVINVDITGLTGSALVIDADMSEFTGTINIIGTGAASYEITEDGLVVKVAEYVAEVNGVKYATLDEAVAYLKANGGTIKLLSDIGGSMTFNDKTGEFATKNPITVDLNGFTITSAESTLWVSDGYVVTIMDSSEAKTGKITTTTNDEVVGIARNGKVIFESGTVEGIAFGVYIYDTNDTDKEVFVMNGGTITVPNGGIAFGISSGKAIINGGEVLCNKYQGGSGWCSVVYDVTATLTITGGKFLGTIGNWGIIAISGGTFSYCGDVNDGFNNEHLAAGYTTQTNDDGSITVVKLPSAAKIGDVEYSTIEEALRAVKNGETIVLIANCTMAEVVELRDIAITIEGEYTLTLNDKLKVFGETTLNIKSAIVGDVWLDDGTILKDSYINGDVFVAGNVTFRGENSVNMLYDFGVLESNYGTSAPMAWTVEKGASLEIRAKARYGLGYGDSVTIFGSIEDALTARESLTEGDVAFFAHGLVAQESAGWNKDNYFTVQDAYVVIGSNNSFGNKPGNYGGNYSFIFNNTVLDASRITFYEAISKTELSFTNCDVVTGTFMTRDADSAFILTNTKLLSTTTSNGTDEGNYNEGVITLINSILTYSAQLTNNGTIKLDANSCLTAPSIVGTGKFIIDATGLMADKLVIDADLSGFTGTIEVIGADASYEITEDGVVVKVAKYVAEINGVKYTSLEDAFKAAVEGDTIKLIADIDVNETIVIPEGLTLTLDIGSYTLSYESNVGGEDMITNYGNLTIVGTGTITYKNTSTEDFNVTASTITNGPGGTLVINGGNIVNTTSDTYAWQSNGIYPFAVDNVTNGNSGDAKLTINGGKLQSTYRTVRAFCNSTICKNEVVINGGEFVGQVWIQSPNTKNNISSIEIEAGTFAPAGNDGSSVYITTNNSTGFSAQVKGGTYATRIGIDSTETLSGFVSGGTYGKALNDAIVADYYEQEQNENGLYGIIEKVVYTDIFTYLGVSAKMDGTGITVGYEFDKDAYALYCEQNAVTLEFGTHFAVAGYSAVEESMVEYADVAGQFNVIVTGLSDAHAELKLEMALYIVEGESKQYVTANGIEEAVSVTYDAIPASYKKEEVVA